MNQSACKLFRRAENKAKAGKSPDDILLQTIGIDRALWPTATQREKGKIRAWLRRYAFST